MKFKKKKEEKEFIKKTKIIYDYIYSKIIKENDFNKISYEYHPECKDLDLPKKEIYLYTFSDNEYIKLIKELNCFLLSYSLDDKEIKLFFLKRKYEGKLYKLLNKMFINKIKNKKNLYRRNNYLEFNNKLDFLISKIINK